MKNYIIYFILICIIITILVYYYKKILLIENFEKNNIKTKKTCAYILRGFLYKKDWKPRSPIGEKYKYTHDIKKTWKYHKKFINILSEKYEVDIYFITYDITPKEYINWAKEKGTVILVPYKDSFQFKTLSLGLKKIKEYDILVINRTDIIYYKPFYNIIRKIKNVENVLSMNKVLHHINLRETSSNDVFFWIPKKRRKLFEKNLEIIFSNELYHLHMIFEYMDVEYLFNKKFVVRSNNIYYKLQDS